MLKLIAIIWIGLTGVCISFLFSGVIRVASKVLMASTLAQAQLATQQSPLDSNSISWFNDYKQIPGVEVLDVKEWKDEEWRSSEGGFSGRDFVHSKSAAVRIIDYVKIPAKCFDSDGMTEDNFPKLVGPAHFTSRSESHRGLCHGGSFCALMDDAIGWTGFCVSGDVKPWSGYTVQINTALKKAVPVNSILKMEAWVHRREGTRKYWISARLSDPDNAECVYCEGEGLFLRSPEAM